MRAMIALTTCLLLSLAGYAAEFAFVERPGESLDIQCDGKTWLSTQVKPFDAAQAEETYKVFTHIYDSAGETPITKGVGGKYTHHRGLFIGWKDTLVPSAEEGAEPIDYDTWHMKNCYQQHVKWLSREAGADSASQSEEVVWCDLEGKPFIKEVRAITVRPGEDGLRIIDFQSTLISVTGHIQLRGDLQHAGMQVRMANEVVDHQDTTQYILPEGAEELENDKVVGAWWACCSCEVGGKRYWLVHMTPRDHPLGEPVYSIRRYARFGAFFEPDLDEGKPLTLRFRVVVSERELAREGRSKPVRRI